MKPKWYHPDGKELSLEETAEIEREEDKTIAAKTLDTETINRITREAAHSVTFGTPPPKGDSALEADFRKRVTDDIRAKLKNDPNVELSLIID